MMIQPAERAGEWIESFEGRPMTRHVDPTRHQFDLFKALARGEAVAMLNLVCFRERAAYPHDHPLFSESISGAEAYLRYGEDSASIFARVGGTVIWSGRPDLVLIGPQDERWDVAFVALYPSAAAFLEMVTDPDYRLAVIHRQAAVATSRLIRTSPRPPRSGFA